MSRRPRKKLDALTYDEFRSQIKAGRIEPLYLFVGEEQYLHERALRLLYSAIPEETRVFNVSVFWLGSDVSMRPSGSDTKLRASVVIDAANQIPMMGTRRILVLRDFEKIKEDEVDLVLDYIKRPASTTTLVFQAVSLDQRRKLTAALVKTCTVVSFDRLSEHQVTRWAEEYSRRLGCRIEPRALSKLVALTGTGMQRLASELNKLATFAGNGTITDRAVEQLVPRARDHSNFELWDAILERDRPRALRLAHRLLDDGAEPLMIVGALAGLYRRMLIAKELLGRGARNDEVARATGQYGQRAAAFNGRVRGTGRQDIVSGIRRIAEVDNAVKRSEGTPRLQIEYLIAELTQ